MAVLNRLLCSLVTFPDDLFPKRLTVPWEGYEVLDILGLFIRKAADEVLRNALILSEINPTRIAWNPQAAHIPLSTEAYADD